jgi:multisubunit Na+/H+ antiporter MnhB subunit
MGTILLIILILLLLGSAPMYPYSRRWGYGPSGLLGLILVILLVMLLLGYVPWGWSP